MEITKLFPVNIFMPIIKFPRLTILVFCKRRPFWIFGQFRGFSKKPKVKIGYFALGKREKTRMVKVAKSCHQVTWAQKMRPKREKARVNF